MSNQVNIVCHSKGGLDAKQYLAHNHNNDVANATNGIEITHKSHKKSLDEGPNYSLRTDGSGMLNETR